MGRHSLQGKTVSLVLGSGGARGLAHIGAIEELERAGAKIEALAGSSMGALVGGIYAAGKLPAYRDWVCGLEQSDVLSLVDWTFSGGGLIKGRKIINKLSELAGETDIEDLEIDFTAVAVDLDQGREVWLDRGPLFDAIRASIAIPGVFTPHRYRDRILVDGGILNPIPVAPTLRHMTDLTVVVDVNGPPDPAYDENGKKKNGKGNGNEEDRNGLMDKFRDFVDGLGSDRPPKPDQPGLFAVMLRSLDTMESVISRQHLAIFQPDLVVQVPKNIAMIHEFHRANEIIECGSRLARDVFAQPAPDQGIEHV
ncbi:patatin-like phospholipase family protein [Wenzhouxiangella marina]|uniref:Serine protease n=1 Tax=Wenzhouxiangella marina TaxID=1579979 RepID=A0A0K0XTM0_9GAMM|nr:patatin-like phospholipase family protein [Wenzhouxiangella marina]AKS41059.1 Serine protease [Wenzhouxiangella marina]MBB6087937.1 NTE family protein [Wenzhouxiangella marina]